MRLPLSDDTLQDIVYGLYQPDRVDHMVDYDSVAMTLSFGGIPITVVTKRITTHGSTTHDCRVTVYPAFTGPIDPDDADSLHSRNVAPIENEAPSYLKFIAKEFRKGVARVDTNPEATVYDRVADGRRTVELSEGEGIPRDPPELNQDERNRALASDSSEPASAIGVDLCGEVEWWYPLSQSGGSVQNYVRLDEEPEQVYNGAVNGQLVDAFRDGFAGFKGGSLPSTIGRADQIPVYSSKLHRLRATAVTISGDGVETQQSLSAFADGAAGLNFNPTHAATR